MAGERTIVEILNERLAKGADESLFLVRRGGEWRGLTGRECARRVRATALALRRPDRAGRAEAEGGGLAKGDRVAILSDVRPEWAQCDLGTLAAGLVTVGLYTSAPAAQIGRLLTHAEAKVVFVDSPERLEKVRAVRGGCPALRLVVAFDDPEAPRPIVPGSLAPDRGEVPLSSFLRSGEEADRRAPAAYDLLCVSVRPDDLATIIYTSGTTGAPKGVMLSHRNIGAVIEAAKDLVPSGPDDLGVAFLPMAHALQRIAGYVGLANGVRGAYAESLERLFDDFRDVRPTLQASVPRMWEKAYARIRERIEAGSSVRNLLFRWALRAGTRFGEYRKRKAERFAPLRLRLEHALADRLVFRRIRDFFGGRVRYLTSGGAPISTEILEFFYAMGILILEGWGLTETAAPATLNTPDAFRFGTVGRPIPGVLLTIAAPDGEVLVRGPGVFRGYYRDEEATREAFTPDGFFKTGDIGEIDEDGFLRITDRKKNLIVTSAGKKIAPAAVEALIKRCPLVSQVYLHGDRRAYLVALITLDRVEAAGKDPAAVLRAVGSAVDAANAELARYEQVKRFRLLDGEFTQEEGLLTPTLKVKRKAVEERYAHAIEELYAEEDVRA